MIRRVAVLVSAALIAYTYALFPLIVVMRGLLRRRPVAAAAIEPTVSIVIAARDEERAIGHKLAGLAALDYPGDRLEVVIASDGSTDGTNEIVRRFAADHGADGPAIHLLELPASGKADALTAAAGAARGEILVFSDANSHYARNALRNLLRPLADPAVGGVAGNQIYTRAGRAGPVAGEVGYWGYDRLLKEFESRGGSAIGGTGAIYAIRRSLFRPIPPGVNDDFFETAGVVDQGFRLVFAADAVAWEPPAEDVGAEYERKVRVISRGIRCVATMPHLLDPRRHGFYAIELWSHKVLRWAMAVPLAGLVLSTAGLARESRLIRLAFLAQAAAYALALVGLAGRSTSLGAHRAVSVPAYFVMVNAAALRAGWNLATGRRIDRWQPNRGRVADGAGSRLDVGTEHVAPAPANVAPPREAVERQPVVTR